jgi:methyl-accepting chemotaxis protein/methyl-accepting chemotaxis protein-1 (serine sensor receptor)
MRSGPVQAGYKKSFSRSVEMNVVFGFLRPAVALMNRLTFARKIGLIGFLFSVPVAVLAVLLVNKFNGEIAFAAAERSGLEVVRPARAALQSLQAHRGTSQLVIGGDSAAQGRLDELAGKIEQAFAAIDTLDKTYGVDFKTQAAWSELRAAWGKLKAENRGLNADESFARHSVLVEKLTAFMTATADGSNLSLDPDMDTYYLMDAIVFRVPSLAESVARMRGLGAEIGVRKDIKAEERVEFAVLGKLAEIDSGNLQGSVAKVFGYNAASKAALESKVKSALESVETFRADVQNKVVKAEKISYDPKSYFAAGTSAVNSLYLIFDAAGEGLDGLLQARISRIRGMRDQVIAGVSVVFSVVLYLFFGFTVGMRKSLKGILEGTERMAIGNLATEVNLETRDELRDICTAVNKVMETVNGFAAAQVKMSELHEAGTISYRIAADNYPGTYGQLATVTNNLVAAHIAVKMRVVDVVSEYAKGNLTIDMDRLPGEKAAITEAIDAVKKQLLGINGEIKALVDAASAGEFGMRGHEENYQHTFREMIVGLNKLMQTCQTGLEEVSLVMGRVAQGDLTARMEGNYQGAFERIKLDTNATVEQLTAIVGEIRQATETINTAAKEIAMGNTDLSQRTEEQASSLQQTASSMEEITSTVKQNADNARQANQLAESASQIAVKGGAVVGQVVGTMEAITSSSKKIVDIISVIDGIAFQTNILALNAAVEAARAGEQGRGFAVVATEVRNLAQRSANAAKEIKGLIGDSVEKVEVGSKLVADAGTTMDEVVKSVKRVTDIMAEITAASVEQSAGIEQVNQAVAQMDKVTQQNAALVEQAASAAGSMEEQASGLTRTVGVFQLAGGGGTVSRASVPARNTLRAPKREARPRAAIGNRSTPTSEDEWEEF